MPMPAFDVPYAAPRPVVILVYSTGHCRLQNSYIQRSSAGSMLVFDYHLFIVSTRANLRRKQFLPVQLLVLNLWSLAQLEITYHSKERGKLGSQTRIIHDVGLPLGELVANGNEFAEPRRLNESLINAVEVDCDATRGGDRIMPLSVPREVWMWPVHLFPTSLFKHLSSFAPLFPFQLSSHRQSSPACRYMKDMTL
jgi:hypothetical protein